MIPETIDPLAMLDALNEWGWRDYQIEEECGFSTGYVAHVRSGRIKTLLYPTAARLLNFHEKHTPRHIVSHGTDCSQS